MKLIESIKTDIIKDVLDGIIPTNCKSFSELHNYVDANEYGGLCNSSSPFHIEKFASMQIAIEAANIAQIEINCWIKAGGIAKLTAKYKRDLTIVPSEMPVDLPAM
jgi:hypothetical protein